MTNVTFPGVRKVGKWPPRRRDFVNHVGGRAAHITLVSDEPGIRGLFRYRPEAAQPLTQLSEVLLCGDGTLSRGERELIAAYVSSLNRCRFCYHTHAAFAAIRIPGGMALVDQVRADLPNAPIPGKLKALLAIAGAVQRGGQEVTGEHVDAARREGATDEEIHDAVLIAAAFCMYNRYVDGLATLACDDPEHYAERARLTGGYVATWKEARQGARQEARLDTRREAGKEAARRETGREALGPALVEAPDGTLEVALDGTLVEAPDGTLEVVLDEAC